MPTRSSGGIQSFFSLDNWLLLRELLRGVPLRELFGGAGRALFGGAARLVAASVPLLPLLLLLLAVRLEELGGAGFLPLDAGTETGWRALRMRLAVPRSTSIVIAGGVISCDGYRFVSCA